MPDPFLWRRRVVLIIYNLLLPFALLCLLPRAIVKMRKRGGYGSNFWQRLGFFGGDLAAKLRSGPKPYWLHAVSVGEVGVARKLIKEILRREPERRLVLSTTTSTGYAIALKDAPEALTVIYSPVDFLFIVARVLRLVRPENLIFIEAEVWPNLTCLAKRLGVSLILANARLSPRSGRRYAKFRWMVEPIFFLLDRVMVQFPEGVDRWRNIGAREGAIVVTGSIKYDEPTMKVGRAEEFRGLLHQHWGTQLPRMILGASTFPGEETLLGKIMLELRAEFPGLRLILVPRHAERAPEVKTELEALGLIVSLRSEAAVENADVLLVNTTGELRDWQQLPDVVVIGKSFCATGGQNPVEAIAAGTPVITGPEMGNFSYVMKLLLEAKALRQLEGEGSLKSAIAEILHHPDDAREATKRGREALAEHHGATKRSAEMIATTP